MIARSKDNSINAAQLADAMGCSTHHVAKIMLQLTRQGFIGSKRGLHGGFKLAKIPNTVSLYDIYVALEGPLDETSCMAPSKVCPFGKCMLGGIKRQVNMLLSDTLKKHTLDIMMDESFDLSILVPKP